MERTFQKLGCSKGRGSKVRKEMVSVAGGLGGGWRWSRMFPRLEQNVHDKAASHRKSRERDQWTFNTR